VIARTRAPSIVHLLLALTLGCGGVTPDSPGHGPSNEEARPADPPPDTAPPSEHPEPPAPPKDEAPAADDHDAFGTRNLYPSVPGGRRWAARWNEYPRTLKVWQVDPHDPEFQLRGSAHTLEILGDGTARSSGRIIRFYIGTKEERWLNTELTVYAMRVTETAKAPGSSGFEFQTRSGDGHQEGNFRNKEGLDKRCDGHAYSYSLRFDGRAVLEKELKHPTYTSQVTKPLWGGRPMPRNEWVGIKVITYDLNGGRVKQELWLDLTDGENGGTWQKVHEHVDEGGWSIPPEEARSCRIAPDQRITTPEPFIILRNHGIREQWYKKLTVREIQPPAG
jgi:hypothetical protein